MSRSYEPLKMIVLDDVNKSISLIPIFYTAY